MARSITRESELQGSFTRLLKTDDGRDWVTRSNVYLFHSEVTVAAYELKVATGSRFRINQIEDHQIEALKRSWYGGQRYPLTHKISDSGIGRKPFDCFFMDGGVPAYVVVGFKDAVACPCYALTITSIENAIDDGVTSVDEDWCKEHGYLVPLV